MKWIIKEVRRDLPLLERILISRGIKDFESFLNPKISHLHSPFLFEEMEKSVKKILEEIEKGSKIGIFGDYDADGLCASSFLYRKLKEIGAKVVLYIPSRLKEGYGISINGIEALRKRNIKLLISVDCGISAFEEIEYAKKYGIETIITDHHEPLKKLPDAFSIINPKISKNYPFKYLSGAGVAFKLIEAIYEKLNFEKNDLYWDLDLIAIGTIADQVPLVDENRIFSYFGLKVIENTKKAGIKAIKKIGGIKNRVNEFDVNFIIAPRLNVSGRMEHAKKSAQLLITKDGDIAISIAEDLEEKNKLRQKTQDFIYEEAKKFLKEDRFVNVIWNKEFHEGVIGIVASKILEETGKPTFIFKISDGIAKGSARSIEEFDLIYALQRCEDLFIEYGGHKLAAGIKMNEKNLKIFEERIEEIAKELLDKEKIKKKIYIDTVASLKEIIEEGEKVLEKLAPFGEGNPPPVFLIKNLKVLSKNKEKKYIYLGEENYFIKGYIQNENKDFEIGEVIDLVCELKIKGEKFLKIIDYNLKNPDFL